MKKLVIYGVRTRLFCYLRVFKTKEDNFCLRGVAFSPNHEENIFPIKRHGSC